jgi:DNA primase
MSWLDDFVAFSQARLGNREREALWTRGVSDAQIDLYRLGYLNRALPAGLPEEFTKFAWSGQRLDDVFVLPLTNILGQLKGLQFRHVVPGIKGYLTYYHDRDESVYFGLGQAIPKMWESEVAFVVEGAFDVFPIQRVFENTFSALTLGTNEALAQLLRRFVKQVWLAYDNDKSGRQACQDFKNDYGDRLDVRILAPPRVRITDTEYTKDPNDLWALWGDDRFRRDYLLRQVEPYMNMENKSHA